MHQRNIYLDNMPLEEAIDKYYNRLRQVGALKPLPAESIAVDDALGRVTAEPVFAQVSSPHYHASAMDGMAVAAKDTFGAGETTPLRLALGIMAFPVDTGDPLPAGTDAVIMIEQVHFVNDQTIEITAAAAPWQHIRPLGEDMVATEMIIPANHTIGPYDLGGLLAGGIIKINVRPKPVVVILPTGTELVQPNQALKAGDIVEFNSRILGGLVTQWGGNPIRKPITVDNFDLLKQAFLEAVQQGDMVLINAGSSAGSEDFTASLIAELGEVVVHGIAIKPGKPAILGHIQGKPVVGVPGYPVSASLTSDLFVKPLIAALAGIEAPKRETIQAIISRKVISPGGVDEFMRVKLGLVGEKIISTPISRGSGVITSMIRADGLVKIPRLREGFEAGQEIPVELFRPLEDIKGTTVAIGSHDITLDVLANLLHVKNSRRSLSSANVGSLGGIMALRRGEAHIAGIHLLDEATGEYNVPYLQRLLPGKGLVLVNLVYRVQGLMVPKDNPQGIKSIKDIADRQEIRFINRQKGAGTRILLDYELKGLGIEPEAINGYYREEYTHMAIAAAVAGGIADTGLGILAAAKALNLDFIPVAQERYDLLIPIEFLHTSYIEDILEIVRTSLFQDQVMALGGYDTKDTGQIMYSTQKGGTNHAGSSSKGN